MIMIMIMIIIFIYVLSISAANISVYYFGPESSVINSFLFIGLDLSIRDKLHDIFSKSNLQLKMTLLIIISGIVSYVVNPASGIIALASVASFIISSFVDSFFYELFSANKYVIRSNGSNIFGAVVDSVVFPTIAFGTILPVIMLSQFFAKITGGILFSFIIFYITKWSAKCQS